jgi:hypothetical protein
MPLLFFIIRQLKEQLTKIKVAFKDKSPYLIEVRKKQFI